MAWPCLFLLDLLAQGLDGPAFLTLIRFAGLVLFILVGFAGLALLVPVGFDGLALLILI